MSIDFQQGKNMLELKNYPKAIKLFQNVLKENPENYASLNGMAVAKIRIGIEQQDRTLLEEAIKHLEEANRIFKKNHPDGGDDTYIEGNLEWAKEEWKKLKNE